MADADDLEWIKRIRNGDRAAFEKLVRRYEDRLFETVLRLMGNKEDAQDVVQEAFIQAFQSLHTYRRDSQFFTWLYRIGYNVAVSHKRKQRADPAQSSSLLTPQDERQIQEALKQLSPEHKEVIVLKDIDGLNYEEIAKILGLSVGTLRSRLHQARLELRKVLENQINDPDRQADRPVIVDPSELTDAQLIAESLNGNHWAYPQLMTRYEEQLDSMIAELVLKRTAREALRKAVVVAVFHLLATFPRDMPFVSWLYQNVKQILGQSEGGEPAA